jgi:hypothetical protein
MSDLGEVVFAAYRPKAGKADVLRELVRGHVATLREIGLATARPATVVSAEDGTLIEIFEWVAGGAQQAHDHPRVQEIWGAMGDVCDFVALSEIAETARPFSHYTPVEL